MNLNGKKEDLSGWAKEATSNTRGPQRKKRGPPGKSSIWVRYSAEEYGRQRWRKDDYHDGSCLWTPRYNLTLNRSDLRAYAISLWDPKPQMKWNCLNVPFEDHANRLFLTTREVKNYYEPRPYRIGQFWVVSFDKAKLKLTTFFSSIFPTSAEGLLHIGPQTPKGLWNESIWQSVKGNVCHYPYNLDGLDNQSGYSRCWQVLASQGCLGWFFI